MICIRSVGDWGLNLAFHLLSMNDFVPDRNILPCFRSRFRCPLTTAPVRTEGLFQRPTVVILHREQTRPQDPSRRTSETFDSNSSARIFVVARQRRGVPLSDKLRFVRQRSSLCRAGTFSPVERLLTDIMDTDQKRRQQPKTPSYKYSFRLNEEQNIRFKELLCKADWSITGADLLSKESSPRSS